MSDFLSHTLFGSLSDDLSSIHFPSSAPPLPWLSPWANSSPLCESWRNLILLHLLPHGLVLAQGNPLPWGPISSPVVSSLTYAEVTAHQIPTSSCSLALQHLEENPPNFESKRPLDWVQQDSKRPFDRSRRDANDREKKISMWDQGILYKRV
jgi:hypothetical protein